MHSENDRGALCAAPDLLRTIEGIYAAACAELSWDQPVEEICRMGRFDACTLSVVDRVEQRSSILSAYGPPPFFPGAPGIVAPNPLLTAGVLASAPGAIWRDHEIMPPADLKASSFWTGWMLPNGFAHWAVMIVGRRDGQVVCLEVYARAGRPLLAPEARHLLTRLAPHLARAWRVGEALRRPAAVPTPVAQGGPEDDDREHLARLRADFGLTRAEARLAFALAEGRSPAEAAKLFGRKLTTIRSQLQQIFAKTGTARQAELVAMLLGRSYWRGSEYDRTPQAAELRPVGADALVHHPPRPGAAPH